MREAIIVMLIVVPLVWISIKVMRAKEPEATSDNYIEFTFTKAYKIFMLAATIVSAVILITFIVLGFYFNVVRKIGPFLLITILLVFIVGLCTRMFFLVKNKKAVYDNDTLHFTDLFGKKQSFHVKDIEEAVERKGDGLKLTLHDGRKFKFDMQMTNYPKVKEILKRNNIPYYDAQDHTSPKK